MRTRRLMGIAALGAAAASILVIPGAGAQETTYAATSDGRALVLTLLGEGLTAGSSHSEIGSAPEAAAVGDGVLNPLAPVGHTEAKATADGQTDGSTEETCESEALPEIPGLTLDLACSSSFAAITGGAPGSSASARVGTVGANPIGALIETPLGEVIDQVEAGADELETGLQPLLGPISEGTGLAVDDLVSDLSDALFNGAPLANLTIGQSAVVTEAAAEGVTATCTAEGGRLDVLDQPEIEGVDLPPIISVVIGDAATSVTAPADGSAATATADPAIATVIVPTLDLEVPVGPGDNVEIPLPQPLGTSTISVAGGSTGESEGGGTFARASAVRIHLFEDSEALTGGLELALADCLSVAGASVEAAPPPTTPTTAPPLLPRTGSDGPNGLAIAAVVGFAALGVTLLRRSSAS